MREKRMVIEGRASCSGRERSHPWPNSSSKSNSQGQQVRRCIRPPAGPNHPHTSEKKVAPPRSFSFRVTASNFSGVVQMMSAESNSPCSGS